MATKTPNNQVGKEFQTVGYSLRRDRAPHPTIQERSLVVKVFIEGVDVSPRFSSVTNIHYVLNNIGGCTITLECPDEDFLTNENDLAIIQQARKAYNSSGEATATSQLNFNNMFKNRFLSRFALKKLPSTIQEAAKQAGVEFSDDPGVNLPSPWLYSYGYRTPIIPLGAHVRVFVEHNGIWYFLFTGAVASRSFTQDISDHLYLQIRCLDVLYYLRREALINQSLGIYEPKTYQNLIKILSACPKDQPLKTPDSPGLFSLTFAGMSMFQFNMQKGSMVEGLLYAIYGDVQPSSATDPNARYGTPENQQTNEISYFMESQNFGESEDKIRIVRNLHGVGLFNLDHFEIGISGQNSDDLRGYLESKGFGSYITIYDSLLDWEAVTDNTVTPDDIFSLSAVDFNQTADLVMQTKISGLSTEEAIAAIENMDPEDVVTVIGLNTRYDGIYAATSGGLKVLMPGNLTGSAMDSFGAKYMTTPTAENYAASTRLEVFAFYVSKKTDFVFYATPKGDVVVEFPLLDNDVFGEKVNLDGVPDASGNPWRSFTKADWQGSYSDHLDEDSLVSIAVAKPWFGNLNVNVNGTYLGQENPFQAQLGISFTLLTKLGCKMVTNNPLRNVMPPDEETARQKANLILARANRGAYTASIGLRFQPRVMLNRNVEFWDVGRAGVVNSINMGLIKDSAPTYSITVNYLREWDGTYKADGTRSYTVAYGEKVVNLGLDYNAFFTSSIQPQATTPQVPEVSTVPPAYTQAESGGGAGDHVQKNNISTDLNSSIIIAVNQWESSWVGLKRADKSNVQPANMIRALLQSESSFMASRKTSNPGHWGYGQVAPETARETIQRNKGIFVGVTDTSDNGIINLLINNDLGSILISCGYMAYLADYIKQHESELRNTHRWVGPPHGPPTLDIGQDDLIARYGFDGLMVIAYKVGPGWVLKGREDTRGQWDKYYERYNNYYNDYNSKFYPRG